jgi:hypothetical protein
MTGKPRQRRALNEVGQMTDPSGMNWMDDLVCAKEERDALRGALNELLGWMAVSGWSTGKRANHERRERTDLMTGEPKVECRCSERWPCPYMRAWRLATGNPDAGDGREGFVGGGTGAPVTGLQPPANDDGREDSNGR